MPEGPESLVTVKPRDEDEDGWIDDIECDCLSQTDDHVLAIGQSVLPIQNFESEAVESEVKVMERQQGIDCTHLQQTGSPIVGKTFDRVTEHIMATPQSDEEALPLRSNFVRVVHHSQSPEPLLDRVAVCVEVDIQEAVCSRLALGEAADELIQEERANEDESSAGDMLRCCLLCRRSRDEAGVVCRLKRIFCGQSWQKCPCQPWCIRDDGRHGRR